MTFSYDAAIIATARNGSVRTRCASAVSASSAPGSMIFRAQSLIKNVAPSTAPEVHAKIERRIGTGEAVSAAAMQAGEEVAAVIVFLR
jgi:hypothetical protein